MAFLNGLNYVKNVGKSFGYTAIDVLKDYNQGLVAFGSGAAEFSSDLYQTISDFKQDLRSSRDEKNWVGQTKGVVQDIWENLNEDLRTGNWYNKARMEKNDNSAMLAMMGFEDGEDPFNFDFDDDAFGFDEEEVNPDAQVTVASQKENTTAIVSAIY